MTSWARQINKSGCESLHNPEVRHNIFFFRNTCVEKEVCKHENGIERKLGEHQFGS